MPAFTSLNLTGPWMMPGAGVQGIPDGGDVQYVYQDSSGNGIASLTNLPSGMANSQNLTVAAALGKFSANRGGKIIVLEGHVETIASTGWTPVAGVSVLCCGHGDSRPTFNWTVAGAALVLSAANFRISNAILNLAATAAVTVTKAIKISAAKNIIDSCRIVAGGAGGTQLVTLGIELVTGADRAEFLANEIYAPADAAIPDLFKLTNAVDAVKFLGNDIDVGMSATGASVITMTTAPTNIRIGGRRGPFQGNYLRNSITGSTTALVGVSGATGFVDNNFFAIEAATGAAASVATPGNLHLGLNYGTVPGKFGLLAGTVST